MNYIAQLELERSRTQMDKIAKAVGDDPKEFKKIIGIIYTEKDPLPKRAAWLLEVIIRKNPDLVKPYIKLFIDSVLKVEDPIKRGIFRALGDQKIPEKLKGKTLDICFEVMLSADRPVAVKVFAMEVAGNIAKEHPELIRELKTVIEDQWEKNTAAFRARARMVLKKLEPAKINSRKTA